MIVPTSPRRGSRRRTNRVRLLAALAVLATLVSVISACSSSSKGKSSSSSAASSPGSSTSASTAGSSDSSSASGALFGGGTNAPGTDVGLTSTEMHIAMIADVNTPVQPGLFQKNVDAVKAWASLVNANGGLAGRKVVVDFCDSKLDMNATTACVIKACENDFAMVGTGANALTDLSDIDGCKDAQGKAIGIPNLAFVGFPPVACNKSTFLITGMGDYCKTQSEHPQTYTVNVGDARYYKTLEPNLHGTWVYNSDVPTSRISLLPVYQAQVQLGIGKDGKGFYATAGASPQSALTPIILAMKSAKSTYGYGGATPPQTVLLRREAKLQGLNTVKVWACNSGCYDSSFLQQGGSAVEGQYVQLFSLPFYTEYKSNPTLAALVQQLGGVDKLSSNALNSFNQALLFQDAVKKAAATGTLNRTTLFAALRGEKSFDAQGIIGSTDVASQNPSACDVIVQVKNGQFQRVYPTKPGTFDCNPANQATIKFDATK